MILKKVAQTEYQNISNIILEMMQTEEVKSNYVITLNGPMGAGKTTFVKSLAKCIGIKSEIQSPTFTLMREYDIDLHNKFKKLLHVDAYRFENKDEGNILKLDQVNSSLIIIEWPDNMNAPDSDLDIVFQKNIEYEDEELESNLYRDIIIE